MHLTRLLGQRFLLIHKSHFEGLTLTGHWQGSRARVTGSPPLLLGVKSGAGRSRSTGLCSALEIRNVDAVLVHKRLDSLLDVEAHVLLGLAGDGTG